MFSASTFTTGGPTNGLSMCSSSKRCNVDTGTFRAAATRIFDDASKQLVPSQGPVPLASLTTSGSGLDPHLPPEAIAYQLARVAAARNVPVSTLQRLLDEHIESPLVGPPVVNVLALNMAMKVVPEDVTRVDETSIAPTTFVMTAGRVAPA